MIFTNMDVISISPQIEIIQNGFIWDLHNSADFLGYEIDDNYKSLKLNWDYGCDCEGIISGTIYLQFKGINHINITEKDFSLPRNEDSCLESIHLENENVIVVCFRGGQSFEVQCDELEFFPFETTGHKV